MPFPLPQLNFNNNVPLATNNPSADQGPMLANNVSNQSIWTSDHIGFNTTGSGYHQQVRMPNYTTAPVSPIPPVISGFGGVFCDNTAKTGGTETGLWFTPDNTGNKYQLTKTDTANFALFGTQTNYPLAADATQLGGWSFLPGGLLFQYGTATVNPAANSYKVNFPVVFSTLVFSITVTRLQGAGANAGSFGVNNISTSRFFLTQQAVLAPIFFWMAIGK